MAMQTRDGENAVHDYAELAEWAAQERMAGAGPRLERDQMAVFMVPPEHSLETVALEHYGPTPFRKRGMAEFTQVTGFIWYVDKHRKADDTPVWVDVDGLRFEAQLNGHTKLEAGWGDHVARFQMVRTPAWSDWRKFAGRLHVQMDFADFIDAHTAQIAEPDAAEFQDAIKNFNLHRDVRFESKVSLSSGAVHLTYTEDDSQAGQTKLPERIKILVKPFEGTQERFIEARLRWRILERRLTLGYDFGTQMEDIEREAVDETANFIFEKIATPILHGTPPSGR